jgi:hypothetical protein
VARASAGLTVVTLSSLRYRASLRPTSSRHAFGGRGGGGGGGQRQGSASTSTTPHLIGLNCRDLATLQINPSRFTELANHFPACHPRVAESGIATPEDAQNIATLNYDLALVGTSLMRADNAEQAARAIINAGREARA